MTIVAGDGHARIWDMCFVVGQTSLCHKRQGFPGWSGTCVTGARHLSVSNLSGILLVSDAPPYYSGRTPQETPPLPLLIRRRLSLLSGYSSSGPLRFTGFLKEIISPGVIELALYIQFDVKTLKIWICGHLT